MLGCAAAGPEQVNIVPRTTAPKQRRRLRASQGATILDIMVQPQPGGVRTLAAVWRVLEYTPHFPMSCMTWTVSQPLRTVRVRLPQYPSYVTTLKLPSST